jgi:O-antigen/teichoic acid export membrane protein
MHKVLVTRNNTNSMWAIIEFAWHPLLLFLSTRYFVESLGSNKYGTWMFLTAAVASSGILNVGISGAIIKVVSAEVVRGPGSPLIGQIANTALGLAFASGFLTTLLMVIVMLTGGDGAPLTRDYFFITAVAATILIFLEYMDIAFSSILKGGEYFRETARIEVLFKTLQTAAALSTAMIWAELLPLYAALIIVNTARVVTKMFIMKKIYSIRRVRPALDSLSQLLTYAKWGWLHGIGGFMLMTADRLLVGSTLGPETLAHYSLLLMIPQQIHALASAAVSITFPSVSRLLSLKRIAEITALKSKITRITALGAAIPSLLFVIFSETIYEFWLGKELPPDAMAALSPLTLSFFFLTLSVSPHYTLLGLGQVKYVAIVNLVAGIASMAILASSLDTGGLYIAAVSKLVYAAILLVQFHRVNQSMTDLTRGKAK